MSDVGFVAASEVLPGAELIPLGEGVTPLDAVVLVKALTAGGDVGWFTRYTKDLTSVEVLGALRAATILEEHRLLDIYDPQRGDDG